MTRAERPIAFYFPTIGQGGIERTLLNLVGELTRYVPNIDLLVGNLADHIRDELPPQLRVVALNAKFPIPLPKRLILPRTKLAIQTFPSFMAYLRTEKPTDVLSFQASALAALAIALTRSKTRLIVRDGTNPTAAFQFNNPIRRRIRTRIKRFAFSRADQVLAISQGAGEDIMKNFGVHSEKLRMIYNPSFNRSAISAEDSSVEHPWLSDTGNVPVVIAVSRLVHQKDIHTLVRAFARVKKERDARLLILGDGADRLSIERSIDEKGLSDCVQILGFVPNPFPYMRCSTVFALTPRFEGFGNVFVEALACGLPVVATDCPSGPSEILLDGEGGQLVPVGDDEAAAKAILGYLNAPDFAAAQLQRGQAGLERFESSAIAQQYAALFSRHSSPTTGNE